MDNKADDATMSREQQYYELEEWLKCIEQYKLRRGIQQYAYSLIAKRRN